MKLFFFDLETTGTTGRHAIHQVAGKIVIDGEEKERFDIKVRPHENAPIEQKALDVAGVTLEEVMNYPPMKEGFEQLIEIMGKHVNKWNNKKPHRYHLVGFNNAQFDNHFLKKFFARNGEDYFYSWFWYDCLDVMILASQYFSGSRHKIKGFKLFQIADYLGIQVEQEKLHDALYDIDITEKCFNIMYHDYHQDRLLLNAIEKQKPNPYFSMFDQHILNHQKT